MDDASQMVLWPGWVTVIAHADVASEKRATRDTAYMIVNEIGGSLQRVCLLRREAGQGPCIK